MPIAFSAKATAGLLRPALPTLATGRGVVFLELEERYIKTHQC